MTLDTYTLADLPDAVCDWWLDTLRAQDGAAEFAGSPEWVAHMAGDDPGAAFVLDAADPGRERRVVLPLMRRSWPLTFSLFGRRLFVHELNTLKAGGGDLIARGADAEWLAEAWEAVLAREPETDALWFEHVTGEERLRLLIESGRRSRAVFPAVIFRAMPHYRLRLPETLEACLAQRSAKSLARLRSKANALDRELGEPCRVVEIRTPADWAPYAERIDALMNASWQAEVFGQTFSMDCFRGTAEQGYLRAFLLLGGERAVAFTLYYSGRRTLISGVLGYDREFARHSPGAILFLRTLERLYAADTPRVLDFGEGDADYKRHWANEEAAVSAVLLVRRRLAWRFALYRAWRGGVEGARRLLRAARLERSLVRRLKRGS